MKKKFKLEANLGTLVVPKSYKHGQMLDMFGNKNRWQFQNRGYSDSINDWNFQRATKLTPGQRLNVKVYRGDGNETTEDRRAFLRGLPYNFFASAQGLVLAFQNLNLYQVSSMWWKIASFDEDENLPKISGEPVVPVLEYTSVNPSGTGFHLYNTSGRWDHTQCMIGFSLVH